MKKLYSLLLILILLNVVAAKEIILDSTQNVQTTNSMENLEDGLSIVPGGVIAVKIGSFLANTFFTQDVNKQNALNQNVELDSAKANLENSKDNVSTMFFFIVSTFIVLFDVIVSLVYIALLAFVIWIVFVGYVKLMIMIVNFIYGKIKIYRGK